MKRKPKQPPVPSERHDTIRHELKAHLEGGQFSARELSGRVGIREREVYDHLEHIRRSLAHDPERVFIVTSASCAGCGFVFRKRDRLTPPSRCPVCRSESVDEPVFSVERRM